MFRPFALDRDIRRLDGALAIVGGALALDDDRLLAHAGALWPDRRAARRRGDQRRGDARRRGGLDPCLGPLAGDRRRRGPLRERRVCRAHGYQRRLARAGPRRARGSLRAEPGRTGSGLGLPLDVRPADGWGPARLGGRSGSPTDHAAESSARHRPRPNHRTPHRRARGAGWNDAAGTRSSSEHTARHPRGRRAPDRRVRALPGGFIAVPAAVPP